MSRFKRHAASIIAVLIGITGLVLVLYSWRLPPFTSDVETTENAYVKGYVTLISPQLSGYIVDVPVQDYASVKAGQLLARIDDRIFAQKLDQAKATLASQKAALANSTQQQRAAEARIGSSQAELDSASAVLRRAQANWARIEPLARQGVMTKSDAEQSETALEQAQSSVTQAKAALEVSRQDLETIKVSRGSLEASVAGAEAAVKLAEIDLANTKIVAPRDGRLGEVGVKLGQYVAAGTQLMAVVPEDVWVIANFKETQLSNIAVGQRVSFSVDALQRKRLTGRVERFAPAAGSEFSVLKPDNATGNFTKVAQRISVRIAIDEGQELARALAPGMSVVVRTEPE
ncbi:HlyD family secretion protein [Phyllobacterium sp. 21LDTY02-6]|uniref:HlyD family secretion protein n=1 Tax=unclassified Phyllobacterium TaxID=2638441 RepID=UPI00202272F7|nr:MULTISPECIES: HlyD family secretion protein [unclassified Phyllobacterium]MCO4315956.1 HlyD family secretion protein [Phyllobacterium sp. 21LDTY02-6]MCX8279620.1 HlyD family secretion protein [Phyllobacterium sp. 0TCS1.6C]MCX8292189.1 HlyD family secretion protein [Phyllobacterium sp. 0TCS1.6A]